MLSNRDCYIIAWRCADALIRHAGESTEGWLPILSGEMTVHDNDHFELAPSGDGVGAQHFHREESGRWRTVWSDPGSVGDTFIVTADGELIVA